jgi:hypothetical protein
VSDLSDVSDVEQTRPPCWWGESRAAAGKSKLIEHLRQFLYFRTSKASKLSTCWWGAEERTHPWWARLVASCGTHASVFILLY